MSLFDVFIVTASEGLVKLQRELWGKVTVGQPQRIIYLNWRFPQVNCVQTSNSFAQGPNQLGNFLVCRRNGGVLSGFPVLQYALDALERPINFFAGNRQWGRDPDDLVMRLFA